MRKLYRLKQRVKMLKDFYVFDTETGRKNPDGSIQWLLNGRPESFQFGVVYGYNHTVIIDKIDDFKKEFLKPRYKGKIIFAHNAEYDLNTIYGNIYAFDPHAIFNGKFISATNGNCSFADSSNIFGKIKLAEVGKMLGILKPNLGNESLFSANGIGPSEINRCITDCEIVYEGLISVFTAAGDIKITQASLSMTYFRRFHQPYDIEYNENTNFFFDSYYGGRTEAFKIGPTHASVIDVNSMYPYCMKATRFPNPKYLKIEHGNKWQYKKLMSYFTQQILYNHEGLIYATVNHEPSTFGYLPYKHKGKDGGKKLLFPVGRFKGCWNFPEIRYALEQRVIEIESIERIVFSQGTPSPFETYVDTLYEQRLKAELEKNPFDKYRVKIFMNSLYGKFAQRIDEDSIYIDDFDKHYMDIRELQIQGRVKKIMMFNKDRNDCFLVLHSNKGWTCSYSIPSYASYITSMGRVMLLKKMNELSSRKVVYCDTDSIFFENSVGIENEYHLGGWKLEKKIVTEVRSLKDYKYIDLEKNNKKVEHNLKGVPKGADYIEGPAQSIDTRDFLPVGEYDYMNLLKTKEALKRNKNPGILTKRVKKISAKYDKRIVLSNGETEPITL